MMAATKEIHGAVIGYGGAFNMGKGHLSGMEQAGITPTAACDVDAARVEVAKTDFPGIRTYTSVEELLKDDGVDLITLITPHNTHAALAIQCLDAGKTVVCEKPMCLTAQEATDMIAAARRSGVMLSVFHNRRHDGDFQALKEAIVEKKLIGDVFSIQAGFAGYGHPGHWWRSDKAISGGAFYDWGAHFLDWILNLMPGQKVESVFGLFHKRVWHDVTNEDHVEAILKVRQRRARRRFLQPDFQPAHEPLAHPGDGGRHPRRRQRQGRLHAVPSGGGDEPAGRTPPQRQTQWDRYYKDLFAHLTEGAPLDVTPEQARRVIAIIEAAEKSAQSGQAEPVPYE